MQLLLRLLIVVLGIIFVLSYWVVKSNVTFDLSAESGVVEYKPLPSPRQRDYPWLLDSVQVTAGDSTSPKTVSGTLHFIGPVQVIVSRSAASPVNVEINAVDGSPPTLAMFEADGEGKIPLYHGAQIKISTIELRASQGTPVLLPVEGYLAVGSGALRIGDKRQMPGLRYGRLGLLTNSFLKPLPVLDIKSVELRAGDTFRMQDPATSGIGLLVIDERPSINIAYRVVGAGAEIERLHGKPRPVEIAWSEVLLNDPLVRSIASFVLVLAALPLDTLDKILKKWVKSLRRRRETSLD